MRPVPILGPASAAWAVVAGNVPASAAPLFTQLLPVLWPVATESGVDPVVAAAQLAKESGWGHFRGRVPAGFCNPCGLKKAGATGDATEDHAVFATWQLGFLAQCQHLAGYAGRVPDPPIVDPRWAAVRPGTARHGSAPTVDRLGGQWAPSPTYGTEIEAIVHLLRGEN